MIITPELIRANPDKLFLVEVSFYAVPDRDCNNKICQEGLANIYEFPTKWKCCDADSSLVKDWQMGKVMELWKDELLLLARKIIRSRTTALVLDDDFGGRWSKLRENAPLLLKWLKEELNKIAPPL